MMMDAKAVLSDLYALKRLYGLLKSGTSNSATDVLSDEHARLLLKNLLDAATKRVLKIIADQVEELGMLSSGEQQHQAEEQEISIQNLSTNSNYRQRFRREQGNKALPVEQPMQNVLERGPENGMKRCRVCRRNSIKASETKDERLFYGSNRVSDLQQPQLTSTDHYICSSDLETGLTNQLNEPISQEVTEPLGSNFSGVEYRVNSSDAEATRITEDDKFLETEASKAIEQIESGISALQRVEEPLCLPLHQVPHVTAEKMNLPYRSLNQVSNQVQPARTLCEQSRKNNFITSRGSGLGSEVGDSTEGWKFSNETQGQNVKAVMVPRQIHTVQNFGVGMAAAETRHTAGSFPVIYPYLSEMINPYQNLVGFSDNIRVMQKYYNPALSVMNLSENVQLADSIYRTRRTKAIGANYSYKKPPQRPLYPGLDRYKRGTVGYKDKILRNRYSGTESDYTNTDSYVSDWSSQQTSSCASDGQSEEDSLPDSGRGIEYVTPRTSSDTGSGGSRHINSYTSNSEDDGYSSTSGDGIFESGSNNCKNSKRIEECSSSDKRSNLRARATHRSTWSRPKRSGPGNKKQWGIWKSLKDGLAIIFHHHHHHHHHHIDDNGKSRTKMSHNTSLQKHKKVDEAKSERAAEKARKSLILDKNQRRHFHGLLGGLLRHVKQSKKLKPGKVTPGRIAKSKSRNMSLKKSHWWQLLQKHKRSKLPKKPTLRFELGKKKTHLKALPKLK